MINGHSSVLGSGPSSGEEEKITPRLQDDKEIETTSFTLKNASRFPTDISPQSVVVQPRLGEREPQFWFMRSVPCH